MASPKTKKKTPQPVPFPPKTWADVDRALRQGQVPGIPAGTDLEEYHWQTLPESERAEIEARNPGRIFRELPWGKALNAKRAAKKAMDEVAKARDAEQIRLGREYLARGQRGVS